jgi:transcription-repair coupling factor (superfamily II helicase)
MTAPLGLAAARLAALAEAAGLSGLIHVAGSERRAEALVRALHGLSPALTVAYLRPWDCLPFDRASPSREIMGRRLQALHTLEQREGPRLLVVTPESAVQRVPPAEVARTAFDLVPGEPLDLDRLASFAASAGYLQDERVDEPGEIAIRGEVVEIFPADREHPVRLDVAEGRIEAVRCYDPVSQRTIDRLDGLRLGPASEVVLSEDAAEERTPGIEHRAPLHHPGQRTVFDLLPKAKVSFAPDAEVRRRAFMDQVAEAHADRAALPGDPPLPPDRLYLTDEEWTARLNRRGAKADVTVGEGAEAPSFAAEPRPRRAFAAFLKEQVEAGHRVALLATDARDRRGMAGEAERALGLAPKDAQDWAEVLAAQPGAVLTLPVDLERGFLDMEHGAAALTASDLFGGRARAGTGGASVSPLLAEQTDLHVGDLVVHWDHGVGRLDGLERVESAALESAHEAAVVSYHGEQRVLVPAEEIARLWRYGGESGAVSLDRIGGKTWPERRAAIEGEIAQTARALIDLAAKREAAATAPITPPREAYARFAARFPFTETADQATAVEAVLTDLTSGKPMDRLVIGDVGFGKTEVALRAAAAVALAGRQVAVVAPTTVLARQHLETFRRRFAGTGVEVGHLSRLASPPEQKAVKAGLADGSIRLVIGTHAVASDSVRFQDLALLIIDEEQRFGQAMKQTLRAMAEGGHVLTLTATPIPRTLQTALVGLQDLSVIATPPARRRPIRTFRTELDDATVRSALLREQRRGGQSFVVVPRIEDMGPMAERLSGLVPELAILSAHGKLPPAEVDETMVRFADGGADVLLATNIIESGLDVPRANTMLVWRADLFGLAQLHQLRGRVGRGRVQGVCYLLTEPGEELAEHTAKRLAALEAFDRLGAGLQLSARDLDIRGAGDLLGEEQAGHMKLIGLELYQHLLALALRQARGEPAEDWTPEIRLEAAGLIPDDYVPEVDLRLNLYARAAKVADEGELDALAEEIEDRFGPPPQPVRDLLALARIRAACRRLNITRIEAGPQAIALSFRGQAAAESALADVGADSGLEWKDGRLIARRPSDTPEARLAVLTAVLDELA